MLAALALTAAFLTAELTRSADHRPHSFAIPPCASSFMSPSLGSETTWNMAVTVFWCSTLITLTNLSGASPPADRRARRAAEREGHLRERVTRRLYIGTDPAHIERVRPGDRQAPLGTPLRRRLRSDGHHARRKNHLPAFARKDHWHVLDALTGDVIKKLVARSGRTTRSSGWTASTPTWRDCARPPSESPT